MSTISLGRSGIVGISYSETSLLKSNLMRANERRNSASNNINSAKVKLQVNGRSGRIRVETDNLQSYYSSLKSNNSKIEKIIRDIDYIVRKFKEVDSRCASRVRAISRSYKVQSFISKIGNTLISFGNKVFNGISNFIKDGISIIKNIYNSSVSWINSYGFYGSLSSGNFNLGMYPGLAMAGMGVGVTTLGPIIPGGVTNNNKGVEEYLKKSFNQLLLGNFTNDVTALGTVGQVGLGLLGADLPLDIRDISADFIKWEWSWKHAGQTALDLVALLPIIGAVKYADEVWLGLKNGFKVIKNSDIINKIGSPLLDLAKKIGGDIKKAPDLNQYFRGKINNIGEHIDNIGYNIRKVMGFEPELVADGVRIGDIRDIRKLNGNDVSNLNDTQKNYNKIVNGGDGIKGVSKADNLWVKSTCNNDELYNYLFKNVNEGVANKFLKEGKWPDGIQIPKNSSVVNPDGSINWSKAAEGGYTLNSDGTAIKQQFNPQIGEVIDRYGNANGRYTSPIINGDTYSYTERSLPYVEDLSNYHQYEVVGDFTKIKEYVDKCTDIKLKTEIETTVRKYYKGDYIRVASYKGNAAAVEGWGKGGAIQYEFSLTVEQLEGLGLLKEIK